MHHCPMKLIILFIYSCLSYVYMSSLPTDIDECTETPGICGKNTICTNVPGTFFCSCPEAYYPSTGIVWTVGISYCQSRLRFSCPLYTMCHILIIYCTSLFIHQFLLFSSTDLQTILNDITPPEVSSIVKDEDVTQH